MVKQNPHAFVGNEGEARHSAIDAALGFLVTHYKEQPSLELTCRLSDDESLVLPQVVSKQLQVDGIRQCVVSQVVWVPVVSAVVDSTGLGRGSGIT